MNRLTWLVALFLWGPYARANPADTLTFRGVSVGIGGGHTALLAEAMSPLRYVGGRFAAYAGYTNRWASGRQTDWSLAYFQDGFPESRPAVSGKKLTQQGYELGYTTLFRLSNPTHLISWWLGPSATMLVNSRAYPFLPFNRDLDLPVEGWVRLGPTLRADYQWRSRLLAHVAVFVPLLSLYGSPTQYADGIGKSDQPRSTGAAGDFLLISTLNKQPGGRILTAIDLLSRQRQTKHGRTKLTGQLRYVWDYYSARKYLNRQTGAGVVSLHVWLTI